MQNSLQTFCQKNEKIIGTIASVLAIIMFVALIEVLISNVKSDSGIFVQPLATAFNCFFWSLYSYGRRDWFLLGPNLLGCVLGVVTTIFAFI